MKNIKLVKYKIRIDGVDVSDIIFGTITEHTRFNQCTLEIKTTLIGELLLEKSNNIEFYSSSRTLTLHYGSAYMESRSVSGSIHKGDKDIIVELYFPVKKMIEKTTTVTEFD